MEDKVYVVVGATTELIEGELMKSESEVLGVTTNIRKAISLARSAKREYGAYLKELFEDDECFEPCKTDSVKDRHFSIQYEDDRSYFSYEVNIKHEVIKK